MLKPSAIVNQDAESKGTPRGKNRCKQCGRSRGFLRKFSLCRVCFRGLSLGGYIPGITKVFGAPSQSSLPAAAKLQLAAATRNKLAQIAAESLTLDAAAQLLAATPDAVRRLIEERSLYGMETRDGMVVPAFQFRDGKPVRQIDHVLRRLDPDLHPIQVINWFTAENPDLVINTTSLSPLGWLDAGGDVEKVSALAATVGSGV